MAEEKPELKKLVLEPKDMMEEVRNVVLFYIVMWVSPFFIGFAWLVISLMMRLSSFMVMMGYIDIVLMSIAVILIYQNWRGLELQGKKFLDILYRYDGTNWITKTLMIKEPVISLGTLNTQNGGKLYGYVVSFESEDFPRTLLISPMPLGKLDFKAGKVIWKNLLLGAQLSAIDAVCVDYCDLGIDGSEYATPVTYVLSSDAHGLLAQSLAAKGGNLTESLIKIASKDIPIPSQTDIKEFVQRWDAHEAKKFLQELKITKEHLDAVYDGFGKTKDIARKIAAAFLEDADLLGERAVRESLFQRLFPTKTKKVLFVLAVCLAIAVIVGLVLRVMA